MNYESLKRLLKSNIYEDNTIAIEILTKMKSEDIQLFFTNHKDPDCEFNLDMVIHGINLGNEDEYRERRYIKKGDYYLYISDSLISWETEACAKSYLKNYIDLEINEEEDY